MKRLHPVEQNRDTGRVVKRGTTQFSQLLQEQ